MSVIYLDTSALAKLVRRESETDALRFWLRKHGAETRVSSALAEVELVRAARRTGAAAARVAERVLANLTLIAMTSDVLTRARQLLPPTLGSPNAVHLATAELIGSDLGTLVAYDTRLLDAARAASMPAAAPA